MENLLSYPKSAIVDKVVPKTMFYKFMEVNQRMKVRFVNDVAQICWLYKLSANTINVTASEELIEIDVFVVDNTHTQFKITKSFATMWMNQSQLSLAIQGQSLPRIYDNFVAQVSGIGEHKAGALAEIVELKKRIATMESELQSLEKRMRKEPQYDVQVRMNKQVKAKRQELEQLKSQLEKLK